jgi:hypothetical protein
VGATGAYLWEVEINTLVQETLRFAIRRQTLCIMNKRTRKHRCNF